MELLSKPGGRYVLTGLLLLSGVLPASEEHVSATSGYGEYEIKSAMLYNFTKFIEWPAAVLDDSSGPLVIGILGNDPFGPLLDKALGGKTVHGHTIVVRRSGTLGELKPCHILFLGVEDRKELRRVLQAVGRTAVLTVGDGEQLTAAGGIIGFILDGNRVRFEINLDAAERAGLQVSSKLLHLATVKRDAAPQARNQ